MKKEIISYILFSTFLWGFSWELPQKELNQEEKRWLQNWEKNIQAWKYIQVKRAKLLLEEEKREIILFPSKIHYQGKDLTPHIAQGIFLTYTDVMEYSARVISQGKVVLVKGVFTQEEELLKKLYQAIENPSLYLRKRDPEYLLEKIENLEQKLEKLQLYQFYLQGGVLTLHNKGFLRGPRRISQELVKKVHDLKRKYPSWGEEEIEEALDKEGVEYSSQEIRLILLLYFGEWE